MSPTRYPEITVQLTGQEDNAFAIIGNVRIQLRKFGVGNEEIEEFSREAINARVYEELFHTCSKWVTVQ